MILNNVDYKHCPIYLIDCLLQKLSPVAQIVSHSQAEAWERENPLFIQSSIKFTAFSNFAVTGFTK